MANLTTTEAANILAASSGQATFIAASGGLGSQKVALNITPTASTAAAQGTEASGGGYVRTQITFSAPSGTPSQITNSVPVTFTNMPACTVQGVDEFDANGTTRRWFGGLSAGNKTVNAGDTFTIAASNYTKTLS